MSLTAETVDRVDFLLDRGATFALVLPPGSDEPMWFGDGVKDTSSGNTLELIEWLGNYSSRILVGAHTAGTPKQMSVEHRSTSRHDYLRGVEQVIHSCMAREGKTVMSRVICGDTHARFSWGEAAKRLFDRYPQTFRYILFTPSTLGWMGATPEILAETDHGMLRTMALAGTRPRHETDARWDKKNQHENDFVTDYISRALRALNLNPQKGEVVSVGYGAIEHLCTPIACAASPEMFPAIVDALNPTPALCGYPKEDAVADIAQYESHRRNLYGGVLIISTATGRKAYVNLRCVHFDRYRYCIYGGGGIVGQSVAEEEFAETEAKTAFLRQLLAPKSVVQL